MPFIPSKRDERHSFRGTTHDSPKSGALKSAITLATFNGVTRPHLLSLSGGSSREKARISRPRRLSPSRPRFGNASDTGQPIHRFSHIKRMITQ